MNLFSSLFVPFDDNGAMDITNIKFGEETFQALNSNCPEHFDNVVSLAAYRNQLNDQYKKVDSL